MISIVVPVYNAESSIGKCIDSILNQTYKEFELLLINDGSIDQSLEVLNSYEKLYPDRIRVFDKKNEGVKATRHFGINNAKGDYIAFVDNDDYLDSDYLETFQKYIEENDYDLVLGGYRRTNDTKVLYEVEARRNKWTLYQITTPWARLYKREFLINNKIEFLEYPIGEDIYFNMQVIKHLNNYRIIDYIGYNWYFNQKSVSNTRQKGLSEECDILNLLNAIYDLFNRKQDKYLSYFLIRYIVWYLLFSGRDAKKTRFVDESNRLFKWLEDNGIYSNIHFYSSDLKGELFLNRMAVPLIRMLYRYKLIGIFARIYCKGEK